MPHDEHFLLRLDRVTREQTELALALYRDHQFVRALLEVVAKAGATERVALALEHEPGGPHVIVARDGGFVTCLATGMATTGCTIVTRRYLDSALASNADLNARFESARRFARPGENDGDFLLRVSTRKNMLSREEMMGASSLAPLFAHRLYVEMGKAVMRTMDATMHLRPPVDPRRLSPEYVDLHARRVWMAGYLSQLSAFAGATPLQKVISHLDTLTFSWYAHLLTTGTLVYRGLWAAGKVGPPLVDSYRECVAKSRLGSAIMDAGAALTTIALRHEKTRDGIAAFFREPPKRGDDLDEVRAYACELGAKTLENAVAMREGALSDGADRHVARCARRLEEDDPDRVRDAEKCPPELAIAALLGEGSSVRGEEGHLLPFAVAPLLATVNVEAFHYPHAVARKLLAPWGPKTVARHIGQFRDGAEGNVPVRVEARVGRNDSCSCGSGRKFKKCCLGK